MPTLQPDRQDPAGHRQDLPPGCRQVARGELPAVKRGGQWFVNKAALPLTEPQRAAMQAKADTLRGALEEALPGRLARSQRSRHWGLADLDAFRLGATLLAELRAADPSTVPSLDLGRLCATLERALLAVAEASAQFDRSARGAALITARAELGHAAALMLLGAGIPPREPVLSWVSALETGVLPAVVGFARWSERPAPGRR